MNLNNFLKDDRRWTALTLAVLAIGILWTLASRVPVAATTGGAPPPSPREGFSAPDFALDLLDGGQDRPASRRIFLWSEYRHPIRVYEILAALGIFLFTMKLPLAKSGRGLNFSLAIALSAGARLLLEAFRGESLIWPGGIRAAQAVNLIILGISLRLMRA